MMLLLPVLILCMLMLATSAIEIPHVPCPKYFQYLGLNDQFIGKITVPFDQDENTVVVVLAQREPFRTQFVGKLGLLDSEDVTLNNRRLQRPVSLKVDFPLPNVAPRVLLISINDVVVCQGVDYPPPSYKVTLKHSFQSRTIVQSTFGENDRWITPKVQNPIDSNLQDSFFNEDEKVPIFQTSTRRTPPPPTTNRPTPIPTQFIQFTTTRNSVTERIGQPSNDDNDCGREGETTLNALVHFGKELKRGQLPWLTAIYRKQSDATLFFTCGGSLISRNTVITAAHCFNDYGLRAENIVVFMGRHNLNDYSDDGSIQAREAEALIIHPEFNMRQYPDADIAMVYFKKPVQYSQYIKPICLWRENLPTDVTDDLKGSVAGWGGDENGRTITDVPKIVEAKIVTEVECLRGFQGVPNTITHRTICAGNRDGSGPCMGDSGGGLMIKIGGRWILRGIVSAGAKQQNRCDLTQYVTYCDLSKHLKWLRENYE